MFAAPCPREHFFHPDSYWYQPVTNYTPYQHPTIPQANSRNWITSLCQQMLVDPNTGAWLGGNNTAYLALWAGIPTYIAPAGYPRRPIQIASYNLNVPGAGALDTQLRAGVPAPVDLIPGAGADLAAIVYQPSTDTMWELFKLQKSNPANAYYDIAGWGGVVYGLSKFKGTYRDAFRADGVQVGGDRWGNTATSISLAGGLTDVAEVEAGEILHALPLITANAQHDPIPFVTPATRADGTKTSSPGYIPEGARIVFPPTADMSRARALGDPGWDKFCRAFTRYGLILMDKIGGVSGTALKIREGGRWNDVLGLYNTDGIAGWRYMSSLPWHQAIIVDPALSA